MEHTPLQAALLYAQLHNWNVFPVNPADKTPLAYLAPNGCHSAVTDERKITQWWSAEPAGGVAIATGKRSGIFALDVDVKGGLTGDKSLADLEKEYGPLPKTPYSATPTKGRHYIFSYPTDIVIRNSVEGIAPGLDIRGEGGYIVAPPTAAASGGYEWVVSPEDAPVAPAPEWLLKLIVNYARRNKTGITTLTETESTAAIPEGRRNSTLKSLSGRLRRSGLSIEEVYYTLAVINKRRCQPPLENKEVMAIAKGAKGYATNAAITERLQAIQATDEMLVGQLNSVLGPFEMPPVERVIEAVKAEDAGDSRLVVSLHRERVLYYTPQKAWYVFDGLHWKAYPFDTIRQVLIGRLAQVYAHTSATLMEQILSKGEVGHRATADQLAKRAAALMRVRAQGDVMRNVQGALSRNDDKSNPATYIAWDADPDVLAVQNGVIDLRTGQFRDCRPSDYIRTVAPVTWEGIRAPCPEWLAFIRHVHSEDMEIVRFMQRLYGYASTGNTSAQKVVVLYGPEGRNGKGVELEMIGAVLGDYALAVSKNILVDTGRPQTPSAATPHLMQLRGKRMVWCSETKEGERADAGLIKYLSGEDTINARGLYESGANFVPTHTMFLATNHKPHLPADDPATWERIVLLLFKRRYLEDPDPSKPNEFPQDPHLKDRLKAEYPGILAWLVRGAMRYYRSGLQRPSSTKQATQKYREQEDWGLQWVTERCNVGDEYSSTSEDLYNDFELWWNRRDAVPKLAAFGRRLTAMGFEKGREPKTNRIVRLGIAVKGSASTLDSPINFSEDE